MEGVVVVAEVGLLVEADADVALVDDVVGCKAAYEAAAVGTWGGVAAGGVGGVTLDEEMEAAVFGVVDAVSEGVERVGVEVLVDLRGCVKAACFELADGGVFEDRPVGWRGGQWVVDF